MSQDLLPQDKCSFCQAPQAEMDLNLLLHGPTKTALAKRLPIQASDPGGALYEHWNHLNRKILVSQGVAEPPPDPQSDLVDKTRWVQRNLFKTIWADEQSGLESREENPLAYLGSLKVKSGLIGFLLSSIRLEGELTGQLTKAQIKAKRQAEREAAQEEAELDQILTPAQLEALHIADLRAKGYRITKEVSEGEVIEVKGEIIDRESRSESD